MVVIPCGREQNTSLLPRLKGNGIVGVVRCVDVRNEIARVQRSLRDEFSHIEEEVRRR